MVQMQGGNDVDYPGVISTSCQRSSCAVIGRPAGRRGEEYKMHLFVNNAIHSTYCLEYYLKPSRIQEKGPIYHVQYHPCQFQAEDSCLLLLPGALQSRDIHLMLLALPPLRRWGNVFVNSRLILLSLTNNSPVSLPLIRSRNF
ncbi:hypothetical protein BMS3Bbin14_01515 [bacterium BMS3Bbin14]|nr:hypothetical protein BMS3Abin13_01518 [bacterium BMS3Abin13]GBE53033.1 hypothetical protein BMS3Bbin14_01515 [bacterium BMS3Bbin14]